MRPGHVRPAQSRSVGDALRHARRSLCNRLARMAGLPDDAFCRAFGTIVADVEAGFRHEELIMEMLGYDSLRTHRADNAMILAALHRVLPEVDGGGAGRRPGRTPPQHRPGAGDGPRPRRARGHPCAPRGRAAPAAPFFCAPAGAALNPARQRPGGTLH